MGICMSARCSLISFLLCLSFLSCYAQEVQILNLYEGDICYRGKTKSLNHICRDSRNCPQIKQEIEKGKRPPICSFYNNNAIICCPPNSTNNLPPNNGHTGIRPPNGGTPIKKPLQPSTVTATTYSAAEMCYEYSALIYRVMLDPALSFTGGNKQSIKVKDCVDVKPLIVGGQKTEPKEFPHMALLGYQETVDNTWNCGGSVISIRWILTAAHCEKVQGNPARWARLGELDYSTDTDLTVHRDYRIEQRVIHPDYRGPSRYNDIALFGLDEDIQFSPYVRPICLNTDYSIQSKMTVATGWGNQDTAVEGSKHLLKVSLDIFPVDICKSAYGTNKKTYSRGIEDDSMMCVGSLNNAKDTCMGDSGGPIQIQNHNYTCMYTQIGITSFGGLCGVGTPSIYTRVSKYIPWIEKIVWPRNR